MPCFRGRWGGLARIAVLLGLVCAAGCGGGSKGATGEPVAKERLTRLFELYKLYCEKNRKAPASEQELRDFGQKLTAEERASRKIGDDLEGIFTSPRDGQKFVVKYNTLINMGARSKGIAWEATGQNGRRFVALMLGYVEELPEPSFQDATK
jgi:hypothetical protein